MRKLIAAMNVTLDCCCDHGKMVADDELAKGKKMEKILRTAEQFRVAQLETHLILVMGHQMKTMRWFLAFSFLFLSTSLGFAQTTAQCGIDNDVRIVKDKPTVYITFERFGKALDPNEQKMVQGDQRKKLPEKGNDVWLRIHNNTCWSINFYQYGLYLPKQRPGESFKDVLLKRAGILEDGVETALYYSIMKGNTQIAYTGIDSVDTVSLPPGLTVLFSVDRTHLSAKQSVRVRFNYSWEYKHGNEPRGYINNEPDHYIEFSDYDLKEQSEP